VLHFHSLSTANDLLSQPAAYLSAQTTIWRRRNRKSTGLYYNLMITSARHWPCMQLVLAVCGPKFPKFGGMSGPFEVDKSSLFVYMDFLSEDIRA